MYKSIQHFIEKDIININKVVEKMLRGDKDTADLSQEIYDNVLKLGRNLVRDIYEEIDDEIRKSISRKKKWTIEKRNQPKEILDIMGIISYKRTGYENKKTGKYEYLLDQILGIDSHQRITIGAAAKMLEESVATSYAKGGKSINESIVVSRQSVKKIVHKTQLELPIKKKIKKQVKQLYIVADEDHVAAQFNKVKGDLRQDSRGNKINTIMSKIICVYEDVVNDSGDMSKSPRYKLIGKHYFSGVYKGTNNNYKLWEEVSRYIDETYEIVNIEKIYIMGDGATWIKAGTDILENSHFVLDKYHIMQYVNSSVAHLMDSADDAKTEIWHYLNSADKKGLKEIYKKILNVTVYEPKAEEVKRALGYFLNNWRGIKIRAIDSNARLNCCAEGQVSHILSARLSSRPMGWSKLGCDQMSKFRVLKANGVKIINLLKYQEAKALIDEKRKEQLDIIKEVRISSSNHKYANNIIKEIPGLERYDMGWMRDIIDRAV